MHWYSLTFSGEESKRKSMRTPIAGNFAASRIGKRLNLVRSSIINGDSSRARSSARLERQAHKRLTLMR